MGQLIVIKPSGIVVARDKDNTTLEEVQTLVGGYIERVPYFDKWNGEEAQAWCDEEGKIKGYKINPEATHAWGELIGHLYGDYLVGDIVILTGSAMLD